MDESSWLTHRTISIHPLNKLFHNKNCLEHVNNLWPIFCKSRKGDKTNFIVVADSGPDYNAYSYENLRLYAQIWKESGLDVLMIKANGSA